MISIWYYDKSLIDPDTFWLKEFKNRKEAHIWMYENLDDFSIKRITQDSWIFQVALVPTPPKPVIGTEKR